MQVFGSVISDKMKRPLRNLMGEIEWSLSEKEFSESKKHIKKAKKQLEKLQGVSSEINLFSYKRSDPGQAFAHSIINDLKLKFLEKNKDFKVSGEIDNELAIKGSTAAWEMFFEAWLDFAIWTQMTQYKKSVHIQSEKTKISHKLSFNISANDWSEERVQRFLMTPEKDAEALWYSLQAAMSYLSRLGGTYSVEPIVGGFKIIIFAPISREPIEVMRNESL